MFLRTIILYNIQLVIKRLEVSLILLNRSRQVVSPKTIVKNQWLNAVKRLMLQS